jgi:hypothetical protein
MAQVAAPLIWTVLAVPLEKRIRPASRPASPPNPDRGQDDGRRVHRQQHLSGPSSSVWTTSSTGGTASAATPPPARPRHGYAGHCCASATRPHPSRPKEQGPRVPRCGKSCRRVPMTYLPGHDQMTWMPSCGGRRCPGAFRQGRRPDQLAKLDFLLRYPTLAPSVLDRLDPADPAST